MINSTLSAGSRRASIGLAWWIALLIPGLAWGQAAPAGPPTGSRYVTTQKSVGSFALVADGQAAPLYASETDWMGVLRATRDVQADIGRVTGHEPVLLTDAPKGTQPVVLIGTVGHSPLIDGLVQSGKLDVTNLAGRWETFVVQAIENPLPGVGSALVVAGSDKRGTIFGLYDLSAQMGVSPWGWWADVPVATQPALYVAAGRHTLGEPAVKYRGLALNGADPALAAWAKEQFGGFSPALYEHVFELLLRLKGNYLWPALGSAFSGAEDQANLSLADTYGIVLGTSPQEPMRRTRPEWARAGKGPWNYQTNAPALQDFWRQGIRRLGTRESLVTLGMPGTEAPPSAGGSAPAERLVADQRQIIAEETHRPAAQTPQLWAAPADGTGDLGQGQGLPDDVTLLLSDDKYGTLRRLPAPGGKPRRGGYGLHYHLAYAGGPRGYGWLNTSPLPRLREQLHLAHAYGTDRVWLVEVGRLKPLELPISFFLDYAWNPDALAADGVEAYTQRWAGQQFGPAYAVDIADILAKYAKYNARRKPEWLDANTYSLANFREAETVAADYQALVARAEAIGRQLPAAAQAAYFELVLYPVLAGANANELFYTVALNRDAAHHNLATTNPLAARARGLLAQDAELTRRYHELADGKWYHLLGGAHLGSAAGPPAASALATLLTLPPDALTMTAPPRVITHPAATAGFVEANGYVALEAGHYSQAVGAGPITWQRLPDLGRTLGAVTSLPVTAAPTARPGGASPHLAYRLVLAQAGPLTVSAYLAPPPSLASATGLRYAVSLDDEVPQVVSLPASGSRLWESIVVNDILLQTSQHTVVKAGPHVLKFWRVDPGVVLEKLVVSHGPLPASYLGPPENVAAPTTRQQ